MPTPADFTSVVSDFLYNRLNSDAALTAAGSVGTRDTTIPQANTATERDAIYPCSYFYLDVSNTALPGNGHVIVWWPGDYQVVGIGLEKDFRKLEQMAKRMFELLHGYVGSPASGGYINSTRFLRPVKVAEQLGEDTFIRIGALWRIKVRLSTS